METSEIRRRLQVIYAEIPIVACKKICSNFCTMIPVSPVEQRVIRERHGILVAHDEHGVCRALKHGLCSVYEDRPLICRVFGAAEGILCPHGCEVLPSPMTREQVHALMDRIVALEDQ